MLIDKWKKYHPAQRQRRTTPGASRIYGKIKIGAVSGSGMTDINLASGSWTTLPWYNEFSDPQGFYTNGAYRVNERTNLKGALNINIKQE